MRAFWVHVAACRALDARIRRLEALQEEQCKHTSFCQRQVHVLTNVSDRLLEARACLAVQAGRLFLARSPERESRQASACQQLNSADIRCWSCECCLLLLAIECAPPPNMQISLAKHTTYVDEQSSPCATHRFKISAVDEEDAHASISMGQICCYCTKRASTVCVQYRVTLQKA